MRGAALSSLLMLGLVLTVSTAQAAAPQVYTPKADSLERKAIVEALRDLGDLRNRTFVIHDLKIADGWAWLSGQPGAIDGAATFKAESALLHKDATGWDVVDQPCTDKDCNEKQELTRIRAAHPTAPAEIFPQ